MTILSILTVCTTIANADPFVVVPVIRAVDGDHPRVADPGHELLAGDDRGFRWAATGSFGDATLGVTSVAVAIVGPFIPFLDVQATASRWGTEFYRERRLAFAFRLNGAVSVTPVIEVRDVQVVDVNRGGWGIGARFGVEREQWRHTVTWTVGARGGSRELFDGALLASASLIRVAGWARAALTLGERVGGQIAAGAPIGGWHAGASLEVATGEVGVWLGRSSGHLAFSVEGTHVSHVGLTRHVTVWGGR
jgi:hypothetical protein